MGKQIPSVLLIIVIVLLLIPNMTSRAEAEKSEQDNKSTTIVYVVMSEERSQIPVEQSRMEKVSELKNKDNIRVSSVEESQYKAKFETYNVSAYTSGRESTGKTAKHPEYGITASGTKVKENRTIACPRELEFGTRIYIPYFDNIFVCEDRGSAIKNKKLDVYMNNLDSALDFGRQDLLILILEEKDGEFN